MNTLTSSERMCLDRPAVFVVFSSSSSSLFFPFLSFLLPPHFLTRGSCVNVLSPHCVGLLWLSLCVVRSPRKPWTGSSDLSGHTHTRRPKLADPPRSPRPTNSLCWALQTHPICVRAFVCSNTLASCAPLPPVSWHQHKERHATCPGVAFAILP